MTDKLIICFKIVIKMCFRKCVLKLNVELFEKLSKGLFDPIVFGVGQMEQFHQ